MGFDEHEYYEHLRNQPSTSKPKEKSDDEIRLESLEQKKQEAAAKRRATLERKKREKEEQQRLEDEKAEEA